jgi:hypothetical protein
MSMPAASFDTLKTAFLVSTEHPHILAVSGTWLDSSVTDEQLYRFIYQVATFFVLIVYT